jgi:hypothetical protein
MAWATDPFYASKIALFYGIIVFCYFTAFHYSYVVILKRSDLELGQVKFTPFKLCLVLCSLVSSFFAVSIIVCITAVFVVSIPVNNSIETVSDGVTTIYNGVVILVGGLVAYRIGWYYLGHPFSISDALQKAIRNIDSPPFKAKGDWETLTEEGRLTEIMKQFIHFPSQMHYKKPFEILTHHHSKQKGTGRH